VLNDAGVSEREGQVLALVGEHLTNAEVAADAPERLARARRLVTGNPIATAILDRTEALAAEDRVRLLAAARALLAAAHAAPMAL
jgi:hypothetical protein